MDWNSFKYIDAIASYGTLAKASKALGIDASTLSRNLQKAENDLGKRIFSKAGGGFTPTQQGLELIDRAREMKRLIEATEGANLNEKKVVVTTVESLLLYYLLRKIRPFDFTTEFIQSDRRLNLSRREADLAIRFGQSETADYIVRKLATIGYALYRPKKGEHALGAKEKVPWTAHSDDSVDVELPELRWMRETVPAARVAYRMTTYQQMATLIGRGLAWGVLPCYVGDSEDNVVRHESDEPLFSKTIWMVAHRDALARPEVRKFKDWLIEQTTGDADFLSGKSA